MTEVAYFLTCSKIISGLEIFQGPEASQHHFTVCGKYRACICSGDFNLGWNEICFQNCFRSWMASMGSLLFTVNLEDLDLENETYSQELGSLVNQWCRNYCRTSIDASFWFTKKLAGQTCQTLSTKVNSIEASFFALILTPF